MDNSKPRSIQLEQAVQNAPIIPDEHLVKICKYRQGAQCCRYIVFLSKVNQFVCVKNVESIKKQIDEQKDNMRAQGDNCDGLIDEKRTDS